MCGRRADNPGEANEKDGENTATKGPQGEPDKNSAEGPLDAGDSVDPVRPRSNSWQRQQKLTRIPMYERKNGGFRTKKPSPQRPPYPSPPVQCNRRASRSEHTCIRGTAATVTGQNLGFSPVGGGRLNWLGGPAPALCGSTVFDCSAGKPSVEVRTPPEGILVWTVQLG